MKGYAGEPRAGMASAGSGAGGILEVNSYRSL